MSKKRTKSGAGSAGPQKWEQAILTTPFYEEDKWNAAVVWIVENQVDDEIHINELAAAVNSEARKLFSHVTRNDLYELVNDLGNPKNKGKVKEVPAHADICEPCRNYLENGEDIPLTLLAKLIKFKLLDIKAKDVRRRDSEKKPATAVGDKGGKGAKGGKGDKDRAKSPGKGAKGAGKKTPEVPSPKGDTKLRRRGEEDTDSKYIDDEPDDGPEHYIFVSGFYHPHLVPLLSDIGVNVDAMIKVMSDNYEVLQTQPDPSADPAEPPTEEKLQAEEEKRQKALKTKKDLKIFWKDIITLLQKAPEGSKLHDLARLEYIVKTETMPKNTEDADEKLEFGLALFEDTACLVYDLLDARRQWQNFLTNLNLLNVPVIGGDPAANALQDAQSQHSLTPAPTVGGTAAAPAALLGDETASPPKPETDMRYYKEMMDTIPQESASVPLVMHCMLEQVVAWEEEKEPPSEVPHPPWADGVEDGLSNHITSAAFKLALSEEEQQTLASELHVPKSVQQSIKQPMLIDHNDEQNWRLHHLKPLNGFDPQEVENQMSGFSPLADIVKLRQPSAKGSRERAARLQELLHFCSTAALTRPEIDHAFKQFVFECMEMTTVEEDGSINKCQADMSSSPWDDPYPMFTNQIEDTELFEPPSPPPAASQNQGPVEADKLAKELEAIKSNPETLTPTPPSRPASGASGRSSRSRAKKKRAKSPKTKEAKTPASPPPSAENDTRPSSGILKPTSRSGSQSGLASRRSSVHFEQDSAGQPLPQPGDEAAQEEIGVKTPRTVDETMTKVIKLQKRNLDQWCFVEHFEPKVLKQVLNKALFNLPYIDTYYHRKDHSLLLVLHNPSNPALHSTMSWQTNLHSNVGFRNYLEHVASAVEDWTRTEEAKYEASLLAKEVDTIQKEGEASASRPASGTGKKGQDRSKSPKKGASRAGRSSSRGSSAERPTSANLFIREGSLKAQKMEMEAQKAELEEQDKAKNEKRSRSAGGKKSARDDEKKERKIGSRSSSKTQISKEILETVEPTDGEPKEQEKQWPFMGYDVGNNMIHVGGTVTTMFPADGGVIHVEKTEFVQGTVSVSTTVRKDGHQFVVHVIDPHLEEEEEEEEKEEGVEKADDEKNEKDEAKQKPVGRFGSMVTCFNDGMSLAFSSYGSNGEPDSAKKEMVVPSVMETPRSPTPSKAESPSKSRKEKGKASTPEPVVAVEEEEVKEEVVEEEPFINQPFQQMFVTCPDGLNVSFQLESALGVVPLSEEDRKLTVKQSYPFKTGGEQDCEALRKRAMEETSRIINSEGIVMCFMNDGTTKLLYPDGKVSTLQGLPPHGPPSRASSPHRIGSAKSGIETPTKKVRGKKGALNPEVVADASDDLSKKQQWLTTLADGQQLANYVDGTKIETKNALICSATDPQTKQVLHTREDHVMTVKHPDGTRIVEHADGTRITYYTRELEVQVAEGNQETGEAALMDVKDGGFVHVESPGYATVKFNTLSTECSVEFGSGSVINAKSNGVYDLYHQDGGYLQVESDGTAVYNPRPNNDLEIHNPDLDMRYLIRHFSETIVEAIDNEGNQFSVKHTGDTNVHLSGVSNVLTEEKEVGEEKECMKHVVHYKQHAPRFFVISGDGSGTELLRYQDVAEYIATSDDDPATAILSDQIQDCPGVTGITILKPFTRGLSERWLRTYTQETIIPPGLTSRDLKTLPPLEYKQEGPKFGTNVGQGLMIGSAVKSEPKPPMLRCPSVLEVRKLIQYKPVSKELRESMKTGLREYAKFVQSRQEDSENIMVCDPRSSEEQTNAANILAAARIYAESNTIKSMYEKATAPTMPEPAPTPQPKRTQADWERDMREVEIEKENQKALRTHDVPKYFDSELGKAFLLSQAPDIDHLTKQLAAGTLRGSPHATSDATTTPEHRAADPSVNVSQQSHISERSDSYATPEGTQQVPNVASPYVREYGYTPSSVRPGNPTPAHAAGQGSPAPLRPKNPTPGHATSMNFIIDRPGAPTPKEAAHNMTSETPSSTHPVYPSIPEQPQEEKVNPPPPAFDDVGMDSTENRTLLVDVVGAPRRQPVAVPAYINKNGRPNAISNDRFNKVEDPVRRHVYTSSTAGATSHGAHTLSRMRGFELLPNYMDFGVLKEGNTYAFPVHLKNTGVDSCRFKIKQPPPSTGLRVLFRPGPVAAGMKTELTLEIYAIAVGATGEEGIGKMVHNVEIVTETDQIFLPVTATVLTAYEYDNRGKNAPRGGMNPGVKWVSNRPPATQGLIRPRRDNQEAMVN